MTKSLHQWKLTCRRNVHVQVCRVPRHRCSSKTWTAPGEKLGLGRSGGQTWFRVVTLGVHLLTHTQTMKASAQPPSVKSHLEEHREALSQCQGNHCSPSPSGVASLDASLPRWIVLGNPLVDRRKRLTLSSQALTMVGVERLHARRRARVGGVQCS